ncbi:MAG: hypothetical protein KDE22_15180 [Rhodobacterales bacterium]|nr:hypothetical protein [Rhodobacterales bacterium]
MKRPSIVLALPILLALAACAYTPTDNPVGLRLGWFSFLDGDDIRAACTPGAANRYRFVYNGVYVEQRRIYEVDAAARTLDITVLGPADLSELALARAEDVMDPWRGTRAHVDLAPADLDRLARATRASGALDGPPVGLTMVSDDFFWTVAACHNGAFHRHAARWPSAAFDGARYGELLFGWDTTAVAVNPPRRLTGLERLHGYDPHVGSPFDFRLTMGPDGLRGARPAF